MAKQGDSELLQITRQAAMLTALGFRPENNDAAGVKNAMTAFREAARQDWGDAKFRDMTIGPASYTENQLLQVEYLMKMNMKLPNIARTDYIAEIERMTNRSLFEGNSDVRLAEVGLKPQDLHSPNYTKEMNNKVIGVELKLLQMNDQPKPGRGPYGKLRGQHASADAQSHNGRNEASNTSPKKRNGPRATV